MNQKVKVFKLTRNGRELLHSGVVVGETTTMYRVYNTETDVSVATSEWFAKSSPLVDCELQ